MREGTNAMSVLLQTIAIRPSVPPLFLSLLSCGGLTDGEKGASGWPWMVGVAEGGIFGVGIEWVVKVSAKRVNCNASNLYHLTDCFSENYLQICSAEDTLWIRRKERTWENSRGSLINITEEEETRERERGWGRKG